MSPLEDVPTWAFDVADDAPGGIVHELHADLCHASSRACPTLELRSPSSAPTLDYRQHTGTTEDAGDLDELNGGPAKIIR